MFRIPCAIVRACAVFLPPDDSSSSDARLVINPSPCDSEEDHLRRLRPEAENLSKRNAVLEREIEVTLLLRDAPSSLE